MGTWTGPMVCGALVAVEAAKHAGLVGSAAGNFASAGLILGGAIAALRGPGRLRRLCALYLWLAFMLPFLLSGLAGTHVQYRIISGIHLAGILAATLALGAWRSLDPARTAAGLFIAGAAIFWSGANTWPGMGLDRIAGRLPEHYWTSATFLLAAVITLAGLALFRVALREAGDPVWAMLGLGAYLFGAVFWGIHLGFRLTVVPLAVEEFTRTGAAPAWYAPWRLWAGLGFAIYHVLAYLAVIAYGIAVLKTRFLPRAAGWLCIGFALLAVPWFGPPLLIRTSFDQHTLTGCSTLS